MQLVGTGTSRLERRKLSDRAWQRYVVDGQQPDGVADEISESWHRVREAYRIDPGLKEPRRVLTPDALDDRRLHDEVLALAAPVLRDFAGRLGFTDHVLAFFDREGFMLSIDGDPRVVERVKDGIAFAPGVNWAEDSAGTNGPGTALASGRPVEVCASEHFVEAWQPWSCAAAPVMAPGEARPVALVDITGPWEVRRRQAILVASAIARAIEERIRAACCVRDEVVRHAFRGARGGDALVAVDLTARVLAANDAAARRAMHEAGALPFDVQQAFLRAIRERRPGTDPDVLLDLEGRQVVASVIEFDRTPVGAILRAPDLEPAPAAALAPAPFDPERAQLLANLDACAWNVAKAAKRLRVSRMTLYRRMQRLGVSRPRGD
jgi:transcriptional regulator of acetoin/glycerol metabolism